MMASYDWRVRHAGLMAIAAIGEGTGKVHIPPLAFLQDFYFIFCFLFQVMQKELGKVVEYVFLNIIEIELTDLQLGHADVPRYASEGEVCRLSMRVSPPVVFCVSRTVYSPRLPRCSGQLCTDLEVFAYHLSV